MTTNTTLSLFASIIRPTAPTPPLSSCIALLLPRPLLTHRDTLTHPHDLPDMPIQIPKAPSIHPLHLRETHHIQFRPSFPRPAHYLIHPCPLVTTQTEQYASGIFRVSDLLTLAEEGLEEWTDEQHDVDGGCGIGSMGVGRVGGADTDHGRGVGGVLEVLMEAEGGVEGDSGLEVGDGEVDEYHGVGHAVWDGRLGGHGVGTCGIQDGSE